MQTQSGTPWFMLTGGDIVLPGGDVMQGGTVLLHDGVIRAVETQPSASLLFGEAEVTLLDVTGHWVTPGLIDQHLHGAFGIDFNQASLEAIHHLLCQLPQYGITALLPTIMTASKLDMIAAQTRLEEALRVQTPQESRMLGIHLEGPFLNPEQHGAHPPEDILPPNQENLTGFISPSLKRITIAPEMEGAFSTIQALSQHGVLCSMGHSNASYSECMKAIQAGASSITHIFNAMAGIHHRTPTLALAALIQDTLVVEMIGDGKHLAPETIQLVLKAKPFDRCILISDCNALTGMPIGSTQSFGKQLITLGPDGPRNMEGRLAGSHMLVTDAVRYLVQTGILPFEKAIQLATLHPAQYLGVTPELGQIAPGALGDLLVWSKADLSLQHVFMGGDLLYTTNKRPPCQPSHAIS